MVEAARQAILDSQKTAIDQIKAKLEAGTSFEDLIAEYGTDPGMQDENNLKNGYSVHPDSITYDTDFTQAAATLEKVGDVSEPVVSQFGIHILKYLRDVPAGALEMSSEEKEDLRAEIEEERLQLAFSEYFDSWVASADVVWTAEGESWKYDQNFINDVQYGTYEQGETAATGE
jgi:parvulin-like peptidyl-prolyl isomerase